MFIRLLSLSLLSQNKTSNQMTTQKQSYNNLIESIRRGEKFLKELE